MRKLKNDQLGFSLPEILIMAVVVILIFIMGFLLLHHHKPKATSSNTKTTSTQPPASVSAYSGWKTYSIKDGIKFKYPSSWHVSSQAGHLNTTTFVTSFPYSTAHPNQKYGNDIVL